MIRSAFVAALLALTLSAPAASAARLRLEFTGSCGLLKCNAMTKARAAKAVAAYEANTATPTTITECRHDRGLVVCFLTRPYPEGPDSGILAVEWWDCVGPSGRVTSTFTSERCQIAAFRAFPELRE